MTALAPWRLPILRADGELIVYQGRLGDDPAPVLVVAFAGEFPARRSLERIEHEYALRDALGADWAAVPRALLRQGGQPALVLSDPGGEPLDRLLDRPLELGRFLRLAAGLAAALGKLHARGLIHKDIKPANVLAEQATGQAWLTGFGLASRLPRERQPVAPPEEIAGTLAYMAPEQTGRMNRSIDARSDLYALGVTCYQMVTGVLPFTASDPLEWVHCHLARRAVPPAARLASIPEPVSAIIMKLLAKTAEERYQTAAGLEADLRRCLVEWETSGRIDDFPLGENDTPDRLLVPEKLYGRERETRTLLDAFDRVVATGRTELVLVSGYAGIGKSSVVHELHRTLVPPRGLFAAGKFDQYQRDIPYASLAQALRRLLRPLLGRSEAELGRWRDSLKEALGANGQLMVTLIPELEPLIGPQPPVPELSPQDAQRRFQLVFRRLLGVFARPEHPLALFLDDLQWLDAATLDLLEHLATQPELRHLLLVGAYRDNEVTPAHPLVRRLAAIRRAGGRVQEIVLAPLGLDDVGRLIADALHCKRDRAEPLAWLVHNKTSGNPFFTVQFLTALAEEGLLAFDHAEARWSWDLDRIRAKGFTDNVVELMVGKLRRLPGVTQVALRQLACLGNSAAIATLSLVQGGSEAAMDAALWEAVRAGLVFRLEGTYRFLHDRVQEAAYALIPTAERAAAHLAIGRLFAAATPPEATEEHVFEIVSQLNRGAALITSVEERERLAEFNLIAGQRAKGSTAYASALTYLIAGRALLPEDAWERRHELTLALELHRAECEFLTGALATAEARLADLARRAASLPDLAAVTRLRVELYTNLDRRDRAVEVGLEYLRRVGIAWSAHPTPQEARQEYAQMWRQLGECPIETLLDLPRMADPVACGTMNVLTAVMATVWVTDENLLCLVIGRMANLSLEHGNGDASCLAYVGLGTVLGPYFGDYKVAYRFGQLGLDLVERRGLDRFKARVHLTFGSLVNPWTRHVRTGRPLVRQAFDAAQEVGDLNCAVYSHQHLVPLLLAGGDPLGEVQREAEAGLEFVRQARLALAVDSITAQLQLIRTLRGLTPVFGFFDDAVFDEARFERHLEEDPRLALAACWYWIRKLQARVLADDRAGAVAAAAEADRLLWTSPGFFERAEYHFHAALARAALCDSASATERTRHLEALAAHHRQLQEWAENCPENFENRATLVGAEIARLEGRELDAMRLYEQAIRSARANGFVHNEALANEVAARFYEARGFETNSHAHLRNARHCYLCWGADGKVRQLDQFHPHIREERRAPDPTGTIGTPVEHLDLTTVITVSQAVSGEIVLQKLLDTFMRTAIEHAGAERGLLILARGAEQRIEAEATTSGDAVVVRLRDTPVTGAAVPESVIHYVLRTREGVILDDASAENSFSADPYIRQRRARSILCLPLLNQAKLTGVLHLENNLAPRVFTPAGITVLKLLASQAATALENTRLYRDLAEREAKIRRLVDANIIGITISEIEGRIIEANQAFLDMTGYCREDLISGTMRWTDLTPSEWRTASQRAVAQIRMTGSCKPFEKEYMRKDGSRVPVLVAAASFEETGNESVAFVLDLTERKRAEAKAGESERRYREVQMELAHANRVSTMGLLTASIAHEMNQPIAATVTNAQAALRWLDRPSPDLEEVQQALARIVRDGKRAGDVIERIRALIRKAPPRKDRLDINEAILEVIALLHGEIAKNGVRVETRLTEGLPLILGDRVQLQQVILNLIVNGIQMMGSVSEGARSLLVCTEHAASDGVHVAVRDSGPGLDPARLEQLFEAFYTTKPGGLGMGLSICRAIIEAHRGRLWATANTPRGAIFQFALPRDATEVQPEHSPSVVATPAGPVGG